MAAVIKAVSLRIVEGRSRRIKPLESCNENNAASFQELVTALRQHAAELPKRQDETHMQVVQTEHVSEDVPADQNQEQQVEPQQDPILEVQQEVVQPARKTARKPPARKARGKRQAAKVEPAVIQEEDTLEAASTHSREDAQQPQQQQQQQQQQNTEQQQAVEETKPTGRTTRGKRKQVDVLQPAPKRTRGATRSTTSSVSLPAVEPPQTINAANNLTTASVHSMIDDAIVNKTIDPAPDSMICSPAATLDGLKATTQSEIVPPAIIVTDDSVPSPIYCQPQQSAPITVTATPNITAQHPLETPAGQQTATTRTTRRSGRLTVSKAATPALTTSRKAVKPTPTPQKPILATPGADESPVVIDIGTTAKQAGRKQKDKTDSKTHPVEVIGMEDVNVECAVMRMSIDEVEIVKETAAAVSPVCNATASVADEMGTLPQQVAEQPQADPVDDNGAKIRQVAPAIPDSCDAAISQECDVLESIEEPVITQPILQQKTVDAGSHSDQANNSSKDESVTNRDMAIDGTQPLSHSNCSQSTSDEVIICESVTDTVPIGEVQPVSKDDTANPQQPESTNVAVIETAIDDVEPMMDGSHQQCDLSEQALQAKGTEDNTAAEGETTIVSNTGPQQVPTDDVPQPSEVLQSEAPQPAENLQAKAADMAAEVFEVFVPSKQPAVPSQMQQQDVGKVDKEGDKGDAMPAPGQACGKPANLVGGVRSFLQPARKPASPHASRRAGPPQVMLGRAQEEHATNKSSAQDTAKAGFALTAGSVRAKVAMFQASKTTTASNAAATREVKAGKLGDRPLAAAHGAKADSNQLVNNKETIAAAAEPTTQTSSMVEDPTTSQHQASRSTAASGVVRSKNDLELKQRRAEQRRKEEEERRLAELQQKQKLKEERANRTHAAPVHDAAAVRAKQRAALAPTASHPKGQPVQQGSLPPSGAGLSLRGASQSGAPTHARDIATTAAAPNATQPSAPTTVVGVQKNVDHATSVQKPAICQPTPTANRTALRPISGNVAESQQPLNAEEARHVQELISSPYVNTKPHHAHAPAAQQQPVASYAITPWKHSTDSDNSNADEDVPRPKLNKEIPAWAQPAALLQALKAQVHIDPDHVFGMKPSSCSLEEIFAGMPPPPAPDPSKSSRTARRTNYNKRGSSGNWVADRVTWQEELRYKRAMGYYSTAGATTTGLQNSAAKRVLGF